MELPSGNGTIIADAQPYEKYDEPVGRLEQAIALLWKEMFPIERINRNTDFFEVGGNSLVGMELMEKVSLRIGVDLPAVMLFQNPTLRQLAGCINALQYAPNPDGQPYNEFNRLREQQTADDDIEFLLSLPSSQTSRLLRYLRRSKAQFRQDLFVLSELQFKRNGFFVEFGATDGVNLSNTYLLEKEFEWRGILAEPGKCWHDKLAANRGVEIETRCVWRDSGETMSFNEVELAELSTLSSFSSVDFHDRRRREGKTYDVETISLNDLLQRHNAPPHMDYLSIDTEGSELDILSHFDFERFQFNVITCEHNFTAVREELCELLTRHGYVRKYQEISKVDDWYVNKAILTSCN